MKKQILKLIVAGGLCLSSSVGIFPGADTVICEAYTQYASLQRLDIANNKNTIAVGETIQLVPVWGNGAKRELTYTSDNENVAAVDETGLVTGVGKGTAVITAAYADIKEPVTITITVDSGADKSTVYNTSELKLGDKLFKYDTLHYDKKNIGGWANVVNGKGGYDIAFISEKDYVLPFDAEVVGFDGSTMYLAPDIEGVKYVDARTLSVGDTIDQSAVLLCYDYHTNRRVLPVFLLGDYDRYIGNGVIKVKDIDHENKTITLEVEDYDLEQHTKSIEVNRNGITYSKNQVLISLDLRVLQDGCVREQEKMTWEAPTGSADAEYKSDTLIGNEKHPSASYCLIKAKSPGTVRVKAISHINGSTTAYYFNFTVDENGDFVKECSGEKPEPDGDVNASGNLELSDMTMLKKWLSNIKDTKLADWKMADMNDDGKLNVADYLIMKRILTTRQGETYGQAKTPENMPEIIDEYGKVSDNMKKDIWLVLKSRYPKTDLSDFKFVYTPKPPLSVTALQNTTGWDFFTICYKDIPLHEYRSYAAFIPQQVGKWINVQLGTDPSVIKSVDTGAKCISDEKLQEALRAAELSDSTPSFVADTNKLPRKVIYIKDSTPKLAYSAVDVNERCECIIDAVTGELLEMLPYTTA